MIRRFTLRDFKGHCDTRLELGRFTMLVGDNASGKTSVLDALALQASFGEDPSAVLRDAYAPEDLLRRGSAGPIALVSEGLVAEHDSRVAFELQIMPRVAGKGAQSWGLTTDVRRGAAQFSARASTGDVSEWSPSVWDFVAKALGTAGSYRLRPEQIAAAAYSDEPDARIEADGTNTAVALAAMKLGNDEAFQRVEDALRTLIPTVERIRIRQATVQRAGLSDVVGSRLSFDFRGAPAIPASGASHGTLIVVALLAILHGAKRPNVILLDDFDHALHPRAQMELVRMIKRLLALDDFKDVQVVATTHSPYVLDELEPSEVYAFASCDDGTVAAKRLSEHPDAEKTRGMLRAGQLWSLDAERDWVLRE